MAPKANGRRRVPSKQPPSSRPAIEGSPLHRKLDCINAFKEAGSDRPTAAYNSLAERHADELQNKYEQFKSDTKKLGSALIRMCGAHRISYTLDHHQRTRTQRNGGNGTSTPTGSSTPEFTWTLSRINLWWKILGPNSGRCCLFESRYPYAANSDLSMCKWGGRS